MQRVLGFASQLKGLDRLQPPSHLASVSHPGLPSASVPLPVPSLHRGPVTTQTSGPTLTPRLYCRLLQKIRGGRTAVVQDPFLNSSSTQRDSDARTTHPRLPASSNNLRSHNPNPLINLQGQSDGSRARAKLHTLRAPSQKAIPFCYRCGDRGHLSSSCRNTVVCFECDRLGHRSTNCKAVTLLPPTLLTSMSTAQMEEANRLPILKFFPNQSNRQLSETLLHSRVFKDEQGFGALYIQTHLAKLFPIPNWVWVARSIPGNCFLLEPPDDN